MACLLLDVLGMGSLIGQQRDKGMAQIAKADQP
jgi:hypothetical protein